MDLRSYLDQHSVAYEWLSHPDVYTAQQLAEHEHTPGDSVVKPVVIEADGRCVLCALPASYRVDLQELQRELRADEVQLASEEKLRELFGECELGAEPPIGALFGMPMVMDESLFADDEVTFQAGTHQNAVRMSFFDFFRLARPRVAHFAVHA